MNFALSEEQQAIKKAAEEFARGEFITERVEALLSTAQYPWDILKRAADLGFVGIHFPEKYGGQGYGLLEKVLVIESFCRQDASLGMTLSLSDVGSQWILSDGSEEQNERILPGVARGEAVFSVGLSRMGNQDLRDQPVKSTRRGERITLNGTQSLVINAGLAGQMMIFEGFEPGKRRGFIVNTDQDGVILEESEPKMGLPSLPFRRVRLDNVPISLSDFLPHVDTKADSALEIEIAAQSLGMARGAFELAVEYARSREAFGRRIIEFQALNHALADFATRLEASKWLVYHAAWRLDGGDADPRLTSMAKLFVSMMATDLIRGAIQIHGGYGFLKESGLERRYRDAWFTELLGGTAEDQKDTIAKIWLGKTR